MNVLLKEVLEVLVAEGHLASYEWRSDDKRDELELRFPKTRATLTLTSNVMLNGEGSFLTGH